MPKDLRYMGWVLCAILVVFLVLVLVASAEAQTPVVNPTTIQFNASADHAVLLPDSTPMVTSYEAQYFRVSNGAAVCNVSLGKPTPVSSVISMPMAYTCVPQSATIQYNVKVAAVGPTGVGVSPVASNPFVHVGAPTPPGVAVVSKP